MTKTSHIVNCTVSSESSWSISTLMYWAWMGGSQLNLTHAPCISWEADTSEPHILFSVILELSPARTTAPVRRLAIQIINLLKKD